MDRFGSFGVHRVELLKQMTRRVQAGEFAVGPLTTLRDVQVIGENLRIGLNWLVATIVVHDVLPITLPNHLRAATEFMATVVKETVAGRAEPDPFFIQRVSFLAKMVCSLYGHDPAFSDSVFICGGLSGMFPATETGIVHSG